MERLSGRVVLCRNCRENEPEEGFEYCTTCLIMFATFAHRP